MEIKIFTQEFQAVWQILREGKWDISEPLCLFRIAHQFYKYQNNEFYLWEVWMIPAAEMGPGSHCWEWWHHPGGGRYSLCRYPRNQCFPPKTYWTDLLYGLPYFIGNRAGHQIQGVPNILWKCPMEWYLGVRIKPRVMPRDNEFN